MLRKDLEDRRSLLPRPSLPVEWREKSMKEFIDEPMVHEIRAGNYSQMKLGNKGKDIIRAILNSIIEDIHRFQTRP
ncbi:hypothetical protein V6N13_031383 [Hibiscus sabdariffa]